MTLFRKHAGYARVAWNWGVAETRRAMDAGEKSATSHYRVLPLWNAVKDARFPWCREHSQYPAKAALIDLGEAWKRCFDKKLKARRPVFHGRKRGLAFRADNGPGTVRTDGRRIRLPKIGFVRMREAARFPGLIRECTIKHDGRRWFACCVFAFDQPAEKTDGAVVGVDVGLRRLATVHDGETVTVFDNPRPLKAALKRLRRCDKAIARSRKVHGRNRHSNRRRRKYERRARLHARIRDIRRDAAHKATTTIAKSAAVVCVEDLNVTGWMKTRSLARATADASPGAFLSALKWKCRREGVRLVEADRWYPSSKTCSECGEKNEPGRAAEWHCVSCGAVHDRDVNAALNLRRQGLPPDRRGGPVRRAATPARTCEAPTGQIIPELGWL